MSELGRLDPVRVKDMFDKQEKQIAELEQQLSTLQQGIDHIAGLEPRIHHVVDAIRIARNTNRKLKEQSNG